MKKQTGGIIALCAAVLLLGGGVVALKMTDPDKNKDNGTSSGSEVTTSAEGSGIILVDDSAELPTGTAASETHTDGVISTVDVKNSTDEFHLVIKDEPSSDSAATYTFADCEDLPLNTTLIGTLANNANELTSASVIEENCTDFEKFGLGDSAISVRVTYKSGNTRTFYVGDATPVNAQTYLRLEGSDTVYTVNTSTIANYSKTFNDFIDLTLLEKPADDAYPIINSLRIERKDIDYDILLEYSGDDDNSSGTSATHVMVEPTKAYLTVEKSTDITTGMFGLSGSGVYAVRCTDADIASAGLSDPFCKVTMACDDGNTYVLLLSESFKDDGGDEVCYGMLEGSNVIYTISADKSKWISVTPIDIASRMIIASYVWNIPELSVTVGTAKTEFKIEAKDANLDKSSAKAEDFNVTKNGSAFDAERYRQFYAFILKAYGEEFALDAEIPDSEPMAEVKYTDSYDNTTTTVCFYDYSAMTALITINGEAKYTCTKSYVQTLIDNFNKLDTNEEFVTTWK